MGVREWLGRVLICVKIHALKREQVIHATLEEAWRFFSSPRNLAKITPPSLDFRIIGEVPERMHAGQLIEYCVRPLLGIPMSWVTEITLVDEPRCFVDEQKRGPYRMWRHVHHFEDLEDGRVRILDGVTYALHFGWLSAPVHRWVVRPQLKRIFDHRQETVAGLFKGKDVLRAG